MTFTFRGEPVALMALCVNVFASMGGYIFGYDIGYISGCLIMPPFEREYGHPDPTSPSGYSLNTHRQSVIVALLSAGCFAGALLGVPTADFLGRRGAIFMVSIVFMIGVILQIITKGDLSCLLAGRFVAGLGVGALSALVPLYQGEVSPKALRGAFVSIYQIMITFGILIAYIIDYGTRNVNSTAAYRIPIGIQLLWGVIICAGVPFLPQSPRQSIQKGNRATAQNVVARMHGVPEDDPLVLSVLREIEEKLEEEKHSGAGYLDCFDFTNELRTGQRTLIGCLVQSFQQLTGANFIFYYGTSIFQSLNPSLSSYISQIIFGLLDMLGTFPGLYCLDRFGRRRTMITGAIVMGLSYMLYAVIGSYTLYPNNDSSLEAKHGPGGGMIFVICIFVLAYGCSWGPGGWVNTGEIAPLRTRAKQLSFVSASNWTWNFMLSYFSPFIAADIGAKYGFVFFGANFLAAVFVYFCVPEMAGLSLEEINTLFQKGVKPWESYSYNHAVRDAHRRAKIGGPAQLESGHGSHDLDEKAEKL